MIFKRIIPASLFVLLPVMLFSQPGEPLQFERIPGLSQNTVYSIMKDKQGFMWIATADGLNRYDGVEMKIYKSPPEKHYGKLVGRTIRTKIIEDEDDLLFSTEISLFRFDKKKDIFIPQYFGDSTSSTVQDLALETIVKIDSRYWFVNASFGIVEYNEKNKEYHFYHLPGVQNGSPVYIREQGVYDNKGRIWFVSTNGLVSFNIIDHQWQIHFPSTVFSGITYNKDTLWLGVGNKVVFFEINNNSTGIIPIVDGNISSINSLSVFYTDRFQNIWAGDHNGNVFCKRKDKGQFVWRGNINTPGGAQYPVYCFYVDEYGVLWTGADILGLMRSKINYSGFNSFPAINNKTGKNDFFINSIYEDENDKVWIGTFRKGLLLLDKKTLYAEPVSLPYDKKSYNNDISVTLIKKDKYGNLWVASAGNLYVKEYGKKTWLGLKIPVPPGSFSTYVKANCIADNMNGWLIGTKEGLYILEKKNGQYIFHFASDKNQSSISDVFPISIKKIWVGYESSGFIIADKDKLIDNQQMYFNQSGIKSFLADEEHNIIWISTLSGLIAYHVPSKNYKIFSEADGLGNSHVYGALKNNNDLWLSTNRGLSNVILTWDRKEIFPSARFINYSSKDGLPDDEFNTGAFHKGRSGDFYFGTVRGLVWFKPENINPNPNPPAIRLLELKVNEVNIDSIAAEYISSLSLPYFKNNLYFRFRGIEYFNASNVTYTYKMEGLDKDWINSGTLNEVRYYGMRPGSYVFKIKAANGSGIWTERALQVSIFIQAPFWQTWWFYMLAGVLIIGIVIITTRYIFQNRLKEKIRQLEKLQAVESERNRISRDMHDEIGSGLTRIALMTELMNTEKQLDEKTKRGVNEIAGSSRQLVESMSEIIWTLSPHNDKLKDLLAYLREQTQHYFEPLDIDYIISFPEMVPDVVLSNELRRNLFLVSKEALSNALKHSGASGIQFIAGAKGNMIKFSVIDNGKGIERKISRPGANGLRNMQQRMKDINGEIEWVSQNGIGTSVNYWIYI